VRRCQRALGTDDALSNGGLRHQEGACDLVCSQTAQQAQCECDAGFGCQHRVTRDEHQAQQVVADVVIVDCGVDLGHADLVL